MHPTLVATWLAFTTVLALPSSLNGQTLPGLSSRAAPFSSVYFIKERNVGSGQTEVHAIDASRDYSVPTDHYATVFGGNEWQNGKFEIVGGLGAGDLFYIKLRNTGSGLIELHRATAASGYKSFSVQTATAFGLGDADKGTWTVDDGDLYFVKTKNTGSGRIEVHRASRSNYLAFDLHQATSLVEAEGTRGTWAIYNKNLYYIKYRSTGGQNVEVHRLGPGDGYQQIAHYSTWFNIADGDNGTWDIGANGDLYFIKTKNTGSGQAEVHVATASSNYQSVSHYASWISQADGPNGEWNVR